MLHTNKDIVKFLILSGILTYFYLSARLFFDCLKNKNQDTRTLKHLISVTLIITAAGFSLWIWPYVEAYPVEAIMLIVLAIATGFVVYKISSPYIKPYFIRYANGIVPGSILEKDGEQYIITSVDDKQIDMLDRSGNSLSISYQQYLSGNYSKAKDDKTIKIDGAIPEKLEEIINSNDIIKAEDIAIISTAHPENETYIVIKGDYDFDTIGKLYTYIKNSL